MHSFFPFYELSSNVYIPCEGKCIHLYIHLAFTSGNSWLQYSVKYSSSYAFLIACASCYQLALLCKYTSMNMANAQKNGSTTNNENSHNLFPFLITHLIHSKRKTTNAIAIIIISAPEKMQCTTIDMNSKRIR